MADTFLKDVDDRVSTTSKVGYDVSKASVLDIALQGTSIKYNVGVFQDVTPTPGVDTSNLNSALSYGDFMGFENPVITVSGIIDLKFIGSSYCNDRSDTSDNALNPNLKLLQQIYKGGHIFEMVDKYLR